MTRGALQQDPLGRRIIASLYLRGAVPRRSLLRVPAGGKGADRAAVDGLEAALARLSDQGMLVQRRGGVSLTPLGGKLAYALACADPHPLRSLLQDLDVALDPAGRLLDLGCGPGNYLLEAAGLVEASRAVGLDRDLDALAIAGQQLARAARRAPLVCGEAERLPFADGSFDCIVCVVVLPYVREQEALAEAARVLRPGGLMLITAHGPGYYLGLVAGRGRTLMRRLFGLVSLAGTLAAGLLGWRLPGARFQRARAIERALARRGVRVERAVRRGSFLGLPEGLRLVARKEGAP